MCNNKHNMLIGLHIICWLELDYDRPHNYPVFTNTITEYLVLGGYVIYILRFTAKLVRYLDIYSAKSSAGRAAAVPWLCFCGRGSKNIKYSSQSLELRNSFRNGRRIFHCHGTTTNMEAV